jgi:malate dehydrogenase (oxaloacetate-decarboxylating)
LGVVASKARRVTDGMMQAAARALAQNSQAVLPPLNELRRVAVEIAMAVGLEAQRAGVAPLTTSETLREMVTATQWTPDYPQL